LDKQAILARLDGNEALFNKICDSFVRLLPAQLAVIKEAITNADRDTLSRSVHRLKGSVAYFDDGPVIQTITAIGKVSSQSLLDTKSAETLYESLLSQLDELNQNLKSMRS
jgi:HPt (histidine-containing phosphotransfer) domain-containing protein